ncbi:hypothetical protein [Amycolatopsis sp. CA-230715]|uniref:hypothetical protein n=1 Tax=Amycolatopsis sp. CA-230715 TaxID=2745196 RepID=UPI001C00D570|nr:hypothetical protein [Amycolatopsis sp. CA-230715]QWF81667.1 hypothetical protein HUW46_05100 [Amycolatopsis sp. CA-230715]
MTQGTQWGEARPAQPTEEQESTLGGLEGISPLDTNKVKAFNSGAHDLKQSAINGGFAINEDGFTQYQKACNKFINEWQGVRRKLWTLGERAPLGDFPYADMVAGFNVEAAIDGTNSLLPNIDLMVDGYKQALEAMTIARKNYDEKDEEANQCFAKMKQEHGEA